VRILALWLFVFLVGFGQGWVLSPAPYRFSHTTKRPIMFVSLDQSGNPIGLCSLVCQFCARKRSTLAVSSAGLGTLTFASGWHRGQRS